MRHSKKHSKSSCSMINEAIDDEKKGAAFYQKMKKSIHGSSHKHRLAEVVNDEKRHLALMRRMKKNLCK